MDTVKAYFEAQAKHSRQLRALISKTLAKWTDEDFSRLQATRAARDSAVAALTFEQLEQVGLGRNNSQRADTAVEVPHV